MDELVQTTLRRHMTKLIAILAAKSSLPLSSRPPPTPPKRLWPLVMNELLSKTDRYSSSPQSPDPPLEDWTSELTPPELTPLKLTPQPPSSQPARPSTLPLRNRRRRRNTLRFVPYNLFVWC
ncbi:hypothetical protein LSAT2_026111 [Lamellibrachia satsuma]|nr:hypothetical protein LSAT2_026111 [Lamellibrachia satsuma]